MSDIIIIHANRVASSRLIDICEKSPVFEDCIRKKEQVEG